MGEWMYNLPVIWMALVVFLATFVVTAGIFWAVLRLATGERARAFKAVQPPAKRTILLLPRCGGISMRPRPR